MKTFINLTDSIQPDDRIIYVKASAIVSIEKSDGGGSVVHLSTGNLYHRVKELQEEIMKLIGLCEVE